MSTLLVEEYANAAEAVRPGQIAPDFSLEDENGVAWRPSDHRGKVVVLLFYPGNETLVCTRQLCSVRDNWDKYLETGAEIVGISPGTPSEHQSFSQNRRLPIRLLADTRRDVTDLYGRHWLFPAGFTRAVVVIDALGVIRNRDVMLRVFRPSDEQLITDIYAARGDALDIEYQQLKKRFRKIVL